MVANSTVHPIHFEDFSGAQFERLVFAYHARAGWQDLAWFGQTGSDQGRDIVGVELLGNRRVRRTVIQCVNRGELTRAKAEQDMKKAVASPTGLPDAFKFVCRGAVSAQRRDAIVNAARSLRIPFLTLWSHTEFEENLRLRADDILRRFCNGEIFPDSNLEIKKFVDDFPKLTDNQALALMACVFDRPAFWVPFHHESDLQAFLKAVEDTIGALNVGMWRTREGADIRRIPSWHHLQEPATKAAVRKTVRHLDALRQVFTDGLRDGAIERYSYDRDDQSMYVVDSSISKKLDEARKGVLESFRTAYPSFDVRLDCLRMSRNRNLSRLKIN